LVGYCHFYNKQQKRSEGCRIRVCDYLTVFGKKMSDSEENVLEHIEAAA
jgi:methionyl-tRNA synthetase